MSDSNRTNEMKTIGCDTAGDLLPLYVDEVLSPSSVALVEAHLAGCESCTEKVNALKQETKVKDYENVKPMKKFKDRFRRHKILTGITVSICVAVLLGLFLCFFEYAYSYDQLKNDIEVVSDADGHVHIVYTGDKLLFSKYEMHVVGVKDGKVQYKLSLYESMNFQDLWYYFNPALASRQLHNEGKPFELFHVCPNDKVFGAWCDTCMNDGRFAENRSVGRYGGLTTDTLSNFDKPNSYSETEWDALKWVDGDTMPYTPYEEMEAEICCVEYRKFNSPFLDRYKGQTLWRRADISGFVTGVQEFDF